MLVTVGIAIGVPATVLGNHLVANMLYGIHGNDRLSLAAAIVLMLAGRRARRIPAGTARLERRSDGRPPLRMNAKKTAG